MRAGARTIRLMRTLASGRLESSRRELSAWFRGLATSYRDRHGRRARALAVVLEDDDDVVVVNPWQVRLPRTVILAAARNRGWEPVGGTSALVQRGPWLEPMRFARAATAAESPR